MNLPILSTSQSITLIATNASNGQVVTGLTSSNFSGLAYVTPTSTTNISTGTLGSIGAAYSSGGMIEIGQGRYRLDVPNAAFNVSTPSLQIVLDNSTYSIFHEPIQVGNIPVNTLAINGIATTSVTTVSAFQGTTAAIPFNGSNPAVVDVSTAALTAQTNAATLAAALTSFTGTIKAAPAPTSTTFNVSTPGALDRFTDSVLVFTGGAGGLAGVDRRVTAFNVTTGVATVYPALPNAPNSGDTYTIISLASYGMLGTAQTFTNSNSANQTGDAFGYLGTNLGALGANLTEQTELANAISDLTALLGRNDTSGTVTTVSTNINTLLTRISQTVQFDGSGYVKSAPQTLATGAATLSNQTAILTAVGSPLQASSYTAPNNTGITTCINSLATLIARNDPSGTLTQMKAVTDQLAVMIVNNVFTEAALANTPTGSGGGSGEGIYAVTLNFQDSAGTPVPNVSFSIPGQLNAQANAGGGALVNLNADTYIINPRLTEGVNYGASSITVAATSTFTIRGTTLLQVPAGAGNANMGY